VDIAALMHDIGRITLNEPTVMEQGWTDDDLARWGAEIIAGAPSLSRVAGYVRRQHEPFRKPGETSDPSLSTVSRIIKVASAYDAGNAGGLTPLQAIEELHQGAAYEYDPEVVGSLRRVLGL
jgi:HD-GYP domain-containing protein (c-di-GMP phosphodiesterase class II)